MDAGTNDCNLTHGISLLLSGFSSKSPGLIPYCLLVDEFRKVIFQMSLLWVNHEIFRIYLLDLLFYFAKRTYTK